MRSVFVSLFLCVVLLLSAHAAFCAEDKTIAVHKALGTIQDPEFNNRPLTECVPVCFAKAEGSTAKVSVGIPANCPYKDKITGLIKKYLGDIPGIEKVEVELGDCAKKCDLKPIKSQREKPKALTITHASVAPQKVHPGETMTVTASAFDPEGVVSISSDMGGIETIQLGLIGGSSTEGTWEGTWQVHDTKLKKYTTLLTAKNTKGKSATSSVEWADPPTWWNPYYLYRKQITITNNTASNLATGYTTWITLDTSALVGGSKMKANGDDLRIVYWDGANNVQLDRHLRYMNTTTTEAYFKTQADIPGSSTDNNYYVYYGHSNATYPPADGSKVYEFFDDFNNLDHWSINIGAPEASNSIVSLPEGSESLITCDMGYAATTYNKVFEQSVKVDLSSPRKVWWGAQMRPYSYDYCGNQCCDNNYDGERDLVLVDSVVNTVAQTTLTAVATPGSGDDTRSTTWSPGTNYNIYTEKWKANEVKYYHNQSAWATHAVDVNSSYNVTIQLWNYDGATTLYADWYAVRRYVDPEPSSSMASEEPSDQTISTMSRGATVRGGTLR
jgi:hypothetical protein